MTNDHITVVGAGVAGLAAAIYARQSGFDVSVFERSSSLTHQPGETLHPGIEPLLDRLGVWTEVAAKASYRHLGIRSRTETGLVDMEYGESNGRPWRGIQIDRLALKLILLNEAKRIGAKLNFDCGSIRIREVSEDKVEATIGNESHSTNWILDASGPSNWLRNYDGITYQTATRKLSVCYGYNASSENNVHKDWPEIEISDTGWMWRAFIDEGRIAWVKLCTGKPTKDHLYRHRTGIADATWKVSKKPVSKNLFRIGDAAFRMDPSTGKGVLRAIMSAMMAVHLAKQYQGISVGYHETELAYSNWLTGWFWSDFDEMIQTAPWMKI